MINYNKDLLTKLVKYIDNHNDDANATSHGVECNLNAWAVNKQALYNKMSDCDNWSADEYAIIKRGLICSIDKDIKAYRRYLYNLLDLWSDCGYYCGDAVSVYRHIHTIIYNVYADARNISGAELLKEYKAALIESIEPFDNLKNIRVGSNILKACVLVAVAVLNDLKSKVLEEREGYLYRFNDVNRWSAGALEGLSVRDKKYDLMLSINPLDYVSMSESDYFTSCHNLADGCYKQGCFSYMNDGASLIVKVYEAETLDGVNAHTTRDFIARLVVSLNNKAVLISRCYPLGDNAREFIDDIRKNILKALNVEPVAVADSLEDLNAWDVDITSEGAHYRDYCAYNWDDNGGIKAYIINSSSSDNILYIGEPAYCVECGDLLDEDEEEKITCCAWIYCEDCGEYVRRSSAYNVNGCWYCEDCVAWCERCEEYYHRDDVHEFDGDTLCADCIRDLL